MNGLYRQLITTLEEILPLLGLVLFGDPKVARRFYRENFAAPWTAWRTPGARSRSATGSRPSHPTSPRGPSWASR